MTGFRPSRVLFLSIGAAALLYLVVLAILPPGGLWIVDNGCKFIQMEGAIRNGFRDFSLPWPGGDLDPDLLLNPLPAPFGVVHEGELYGVFSHAFTSISALFYRLFGMRGIYLFPLLAGLSILPAVWGLAGRLPAPRLGRPLALLLVALGTPVWFYSVTFWEHTPAVSLAVWAVLFWWKGIDSPGGRALASSALLVGLATYFRDELILFGILLAVMTLFYGRERGVRRAASFTLVLLLSVLPLLLFQWWALGNPLGHHAAGNVPTAGSLGEHLAKRPDVFQALLLQSHRSAALSILISLPFLALWALFPRLTRESFARVMPVVTVAGIAAGLLVIAGYAGAESPIWWMYKANALFAASPVLILAFMRPAAAGRREEMGAPSAESASRMQNALRLLAAGYVLVTVLIVPHAIASGIHWGARVLLPAYPLLGAMAGSAIAGWWAASRGRHAALRLLPVLLLLLSISWQVYALTILHQRKEVTARLNEAVARREERVVVVDDKLFLPDLAPLFYDRILVLLDGREATLRLPDLVARAGGKRALFVLTEERGEAAGGRVDVVRDPLAFTHYYLHSLEIPRGASPGSL